MCVCVCLGGGADEAEHYIKFRPTAAEAYWWDFEDDVLVGGDDELDEILHPPVWEPTVRRNSNQSQTNSLLPNGIGNLALAARTHKPLKAVSTSANLPICRFVSTMAPSVFVLSAETIDASTGCAQPAVARWGCAAIGLRQCRSGADA